jgi:hypothetical protein
MVATKGAQQGGEKCVNSFVSSTFFLTPNENHISAPPPRASWLFFFAFAYRTATMPGPSTPAKPPVKDPGARGAHEDSPVSPTENEADALVAYLRAHRTGDGEQHTHVGKDGVWQGRYGLTPEQVRDEFLPLYASAVVAGAKPSLIELPLANDDRPVPLLVDLDFSLPMDDFLWRQETAADWKARMVSHAHKGRRSVCARCRGEMCSSCSALSTSKCCGSCASSVLSQRIWDLGIPGALVDVLNTVYRELLAIPDGTDVLFSVMARPDGYEVKGDKAEENSWRDGLHITCQQVWAPASLHLLARTRVLAHPDLAPYAELLEKTWDVAPLSGTTGWFLYGSTKENTEPYDYVAGYRFASKGSGFEEAAMPPSLVDLQASLTEDDVRMVQNLTRASLIRVPPADVFPLRDDILLPAEPVAAVLDPVPPVSVRISDSEWADVEFLVLRLLAVQRANDRGLVRGVNGCAEVVQALRNVETSERSLALALAFARRMDKRAFGAGHDDDKFVRNLYHQGTSSRTWGSLVFWAKEDSPEAYAAWVKEKPRGPRPKPLGLRVLSETPTDEEVKNLIAETTDLDFKGVELVADRFSPSRGADGPAFSARFLYGEGPKGELAGLNDLRAILPADPSLPTTLLIRSHLGTGKTDLFKALARAEQENGVVALSRILYISGRRTFTDSMLPQFNTGSNTGGRFYDYRHFTEDLGRKVPYYLSPTERNCARLFVQAESLHRFRAPREGPLKDSRGSFIPEVGERPAYDPERHGTYDAVILDEVETILATLRPSTTHMTGDTNHLLDNVAVFENLVRSARVVIAGDAFLSQRSLETLQTLRSAPFTTVRPHPLRVLDNEFQPYDRIVQRVQAFGSTDGKSRGGGKHRTKEEKAAAAEAPKENIPKGIADWVARLVEDLNAGKRVVVVMGSVKRGRLLEDQVLKPRFVETAARLRATVVLQRAWRWFLWMTKVRKPSATVLAARDSDARKAAALLLTRFVRFVRSERRTGTPVRMSRFREVVLRKTAFKMKTSVPDKAFPHLRRRLPYLRSSLFRFLHIFPLPKAFAYRYYHATSDRDEKAKDLKDVEASWGTLSLLMYTPTITVGINYDPMRPACDEFGTPIGDRKEPDPERHFDVLYIYGTRGGATPRDLFQASLRVRHLRENRCVYVLDHRGHAPPVMGMTQIRAFFNAQAAARAGAIEAVVQNQATLTLDEQNQGWAMFRPENRPSKPIPAWFPHLFMRNVNETNVAQGFPQQVYDAYLERCGYTRAPLPALTVDAITLAPADKPSHYADVVNLTERNVRSIRTDMDKEVRTISESERVALVKFRLKMRCGLPTEFSWLPHGTEGPLRETDAAAAAAAEWSVPTWATRETLDLLWRGPFQEACDEDSCALPPPHKHKDTPTGGDSGFCASPSKFAQVALEKVVPSAAGDAIAAFDDLCDGCGTSREHALFAYKGSALKLRVIRLVVGVLGVKNSCEPKTWTPEAFVRDIAPSFTTPDLWRFVPNEPQYADVRESSLIDLAFFAFGLTKHDLKAANEKGAHSPLERTRSAISRILEAWSLSTLEFAYAKTEDGSFAFKRQSADGPGSPARDPTYFNKEFSPKKREELKTDAAFQESIKDLGRGKAAAINKRLKELYDEELAGGAAAGAGAGGGGGRNVNQRVLEGVSLVPYANALTPDGQPLLWWAVRPQNARRGMVDPQLDAAFVAEETGDDGE